MIKSSTPRPTLRHRAHDYLFNAVHSGNLVYNTCWEDPRLDRMMLNLKPDSRLVMITSAGCNALDYLKDCPASIDAVDMNPRQNALLQLKIAMIQRCSFEDLFATFGKGSHPNFKRLLGEITGLLHPYADNYWHQKAHWFERTRLNPSFYYRGSAGKLAWLALQSFVGGNARVARYFEALLESTSLAEQAELFARVKPALWSGFTTWLVQQPWAMAMIGVPRAQIRLIETQEPGGLAGFIQRKLAHVLTAVPFQDNYFWRVYLTGGYTSDCCPRYLRRRHQLAMHSNAHRIVTHSTTMSNFLRENPAPYSHYVLLDHQDWLAAHKPDELADEWRLILANSRPGTRILMRSASPVIDFIPAFAMERLNVHQHMADVLHQQDRVGTYGRTLLAEVRA
jgi:S-adenosylmethionine-diacylglycerol 3-amino-3-carboxypropyl transferase